MTQDPHRRRSSAAHGRGTLAPPRGGRRAGGGPGRTASARRAHRRRQRLRRTLAITVSVLLVVVGAGVLLYEQLNGNIRSFDISGAGSEKPDAFGRTPINILVIGSDTRASAQDCKLGGDCGPGTGNADVEMIVHVSADRSNATVMSVPRDTVTQIPSCTNPSTGQTSAAYTGMINSALANGPDCQVQAVHQLTGIPIDHFLMVDFQGVVNMSDAVGGVPVCVDNDVYDTYSHLKLSKGDHTLKGLSALEFLRSRHGFGDGGDLGRTVAQHMFLASMIRKLKSAGTLTNPSALYGLAEAATKALTVDTGLNSIAKLLSLADDLSKVPSNRITFVTVQTVPDPNNAARVVLSPTAQSLLNAVINDQSLTTGSGAKSSAAKAAPSPTPSQSVPTSQIAVQVNNGSGVTDRAGEVAQSLINDGFSPATTAGNAPTPAATTSVHYAPSQQDQAQEVARALGIPSSELIADASVTEVTVVIGADWTSGADYPPGSGGKPAPADTQAAVSGANAQTGNQQRCAQVSTDDTVEVNGVPMTPTQAYDDSPNVPNSAP